MSSIIVCCAPAQGHITPLLAIATQLAGAGHDVRFLTGRAYETRARDAGLEFIALPEPADLDLDHANEAYPERAGLTGVKEVQWSMVNLFVKPAAHQVRAIDDAVATRPADVVLTDTGSFGAFIYCARPRAERLPLAFVNIGPLQSRDLDTAPFGLGMHPLPGPLGRLRNRALHAFVDGTIYVPIMRAFREAFAEAGVPMPDALRFGDLPNSLDRVIQLTVPGFEYERPSLPDTVRFIGPVSRTGASAIALPEWWDDLDDGRPIVHVSQGTVANHDLDQLIRPTIEALAGENVMLVVATGGRPIEELGPLPENVRAAEYLPYDRLFPRLAAFVTNGGYGGLHYALEHGVPIVAAGRTEDKVETTARVAWSGAGINLKAHRPTPRAVRGAIRRVLADPRYRLASTRIGAEIAASPGAAGVERVIAELVSNAGRSTEARS
ncbi:MAG TPA: glycosyltransferase [Microbacteriaceae bacterium]|nr:glycosyltransferase [Microbacteriaceae bacterium]